MNEKMDRMEGKFVAIEATMKSHETQIGQIANQATNLPPGMLPAKTIIPHEQLKAITTRSGITTEDPPYPSHARAEATKATEKELGEEVPKAVSPQSKDTVEKKEEPKNTLNPAKYVPDVPYPAALKRNDEEHYGRFLEIFKQLHINIPLVEALSQMPKYKKFLKDILWGKKKIDPYATVKLTETCSTVIQRDIPKMRDPGSVILGCTLGSGYHTHGLCDLGASINLMPLSLFQRLGIGAPTPVKMGLQLADNSVVTANGVVENLLVRVGAFVFPADFVIVDIKEDRDVPLIFGRPLLKTMRANVDLETEELTIKALDSSLVFKAFVPGKGKNKLAMIKFREKGVDPTPGLSTVLQPDPPESEKKPNIVSAHDVVQKIKSKKLKEEARRARPP